MDAKTRTITLSDRQPVRIVDAEWPVIAIGSFSDHDNEYEFQANRKASLSLRVRQHADGRVLVYGIYDYDTAVQGERDAQARRGVLLQPGADIPAAVMMVARDMDEAIGDERPFGVDAVAVAHECIADLPPETI